MWMLGIVVFLTALFFGCLDVQYNHAKSDNTDGLVVLCSYFVSIGFDEDRYLLACSVLLACSLLVCEKVLLAGLCERKILCLAENTVYMNSVRVRGLASTSQPAEQAVYQMMH